jgi:hypothetical protein
MTALRGSKPEAHRFQLSVEARNITLRPPAELLEQLGWARGNGLGVLVGEADDLGRAQLYRHDDGWHLIQSGGGSSRCKLNLPLKVAGVWFFPGMPEQMTSTAVACSVVEIDGRGRGLEFRLPWAPEQINSAPAEVPAQERALPARRPPATQPARDLIGGRIDPDVLHRGGTAAFVRAGPPTPRAEPAPDAPAVSGPSDAPAPKMIGKKHTGCSEPDCQDEVVARGLCRKHYDAARSNDTLGPRPSRQAPAGLTNDPTTWPAPTRELLVDDAARGSGPSALAKICGRPMGSISYIRERYLSAEIEARRIQIATGGETKPERPDIGGGARSSEKEPAPAPEKIPAQVIDYLRRKAVPLLKEGGFELAIKDDHTALRLDGKPIEPAALIDRVNEIFELEDDEALELPDA